MASLNFGLLVVVILQQHCGFTAGQVYYTSPVYPLASFNSTPIVNGTSQANGTVASSGATCTDTGGEFPCSCLALSFPSRVSVHAWTGTYTFTEPLYDNNILGSPTGSTTGTNTADGIVTTTMYLGPSPPDECCELCTIVVSAVRILFWPVDDQNSTVHNDSITGTYTAVSNGFTFTSPSVYVAYDNLHADTRCDRLGRYYIGGNTYNTTLAYKSEDLSTSHCYDGGYLAINYTELQYPPPNSVLTDCYGYYHDTRIPEDPPFSPIFSWPDNVKTLIPSWSLCNYDPNGAWDPPTTLDKATAMVPTNPSLVSAAAAAAFLPAQAPATPTPDPKDPQGDQRPNDSNQGSDSKANWGPQQPYSHNVDTPKTVPTDPSKDNHAQPVNNDPSDHGPPNNRQPSIGNAPNNGNPSSNHSPSKNNPSNNKYPPTDNLSDNDPSSQNGAGGNNPPSNNDPSNNDPPTNNDDPPQQEPSSNNPGSHVVSASPPLPQPQAQPDEPPDQSPPSGAPQIVNWVASQGLGALIAHAFGFEPVSTATPVNNPNIPDPNSKNIEAMANGSPAPVKIGGNTVEKASDRGVFVATPRPLVVGSKTAQRVPDGGLVIASQTLTAGAQTTVAGVAVSVGSDNAVVNGITHNFAPIASTSLAVVVGWVETTLQPHKAPSIHIGGEDIAITRGALPTDTAGAQREQPYIIAGQTLMPGAAAITVNGVPLPVAQNTATKLPAMVYQTLPVQANESEAGVPLLTVGTHIFTPRPSASVVDGTTVSAGGAGVTVAGTVISLLPFGGGLVVGSSMFTLPTEVAASGQGLLTVGGDIFTLDLSGFGVGREKNSAGSSTAANTTTTPTPSISNPAPNSTDKNTIPKSSTTSGSATASAQKTGHMSSGISRHRSLRAKGGLRLCDIIAGFIAGVVLMCL